MQRGTNSETDTASPPRVVYASTAEVYGSLAPPLSSDLRPAVAETPQAALGLTLERLAHTYAHAHSLDMVRGRKGRGVM